MAVAGIFGWRVNATDYAALDMLQGRLQRQTLLAIERVLLAAKCALKIERSPGTVKRSVIRKNDQLAVATIVKRDRLFGDDIVDKITAVIRKTLQMDSGNFRLGPVAGAYKIQAPTPLVEIEFGIKPQR